MNVPTRGLPGVERFVIWRDWDGPRTEATRIELGSTGIRANGVQLGADPVPYRLDYQLDAFDGWVTRSLKLEANGNGWARRLALTHSKDGTWQAEAEAHGSIDLPDPGGALEGLDGALDCDLGYSPLTNMMPVRRERLNEYPGAQDFVMAWVSVPGLTVHASAQRYEHVRVDAHGSVVRFKDRGLFEGFTAELAYDPEGIVRVYPELARRIGR
jgi:uncharacterized protein